MWEGHSDAGIHSALLQQNSTLSIQPVSGFHRLPGRLFVLMLMIPVEEEFSTMFDCSNQMFFKLFFPLACLIIFFAFNLPGFMILFIFFIWIQLLLLNDAFSILINSYTSKSLAHCSITPAFFNCFSSFS